MSIPSIISRGAPNAVVYDLSVPNQVTITLPAGSTWTSGLHWHETHTEYLRLVQGKVRVRLGDKTKVVSKSAGEVDAEIKIDRNVWHEWSRADGAEDDGEDVVVMERTDPADGAKAIFFWNLNGVILKAQRAGKPYFLPASVFSAVLDSWVSLNLFAIFGTLDNIPVLLGVRDSVLRSGSVTVDSWTDRLLLWAERSWAHVMLKLAMAVAWLLRAEPVRKEFTPLREYMDWTSKTKNKRKTP